jgi:DNA polymerase
MRAIPCPPSDVASIDFEVYSEAGYFINSKGLWTNEVKGKPGISATGTYNYARHPSTRVISLAYNLHDGNGTQLWFPGLLNPIRLLEHVRSGKKVEAHNSIFEYWIWNTCLTGWPRLTLEQMTCTMSRCAASGLPQALGNVHKAIFMPEHKYDVGKELIKEFCVPHNRKKQKYSMGLLHEYCIQDVKTEDALSARIPQLSEMERRIWLMDQQINDRGVHIDVDAARALADKIEDYVQQAGDELRGLTGGKVTTPRQASRIGKWLESRGIKMQFTPKGTYKLDKDSVEMLFMQVDKGSVEEWVLERRQQYSLASVDKIKTLLHMVGDDGRLRGLFRYHGAHTGRWTSTGVQLQNLPRGGMSIDEVERIFDEIKCGNWSSVDGDAPLKTISSLVRGLFTAAPGKELVCADFSAIEGRGAAMLSGEQWRIDVFRGHGKIYEKTASDVTGIPLNEILEYQELTGKKHELRGLGKTGELASQYGGWIDAWLRFGAGRYFKETGSIKDAILKWRAASPMIPEMWGGQLRKHPHAWHWTPELYGLEGATIRALLHPDQWFECRDIAFKHSTLNDVLLCRLPSGRCLWYRNPRLEKKWHKHAERYVWRIVYRGWSNAGGWHKKETFGGREFENIVQAACRDLMALAMLRLEDHGYPIVIHVHDEPVMEVPRGYGSLEEVKQLMEFTEGWFHDWPIKAGGEWRGLRFRK